MKEAGLHRIADGTTEETALVKDGQGRSRYLDSSRLLRNNGDSFFVVRLLRPNSAAGSKAIAASDRVNFYILGYDGELHPSENSLNSTDTRLCESAAIFWNPPGLASSIFPILIFFIFFGHTESSTCVWSWLEISGACVGLLGRSSHFWYPPNSGVKRNPKKLVERVKLPQIVPLLPAQLTTYASNFLHLSNNSSVHTELDSSFLLCFPPHSGNFLYCRSSFHQIPVFVFSNTFTMAPAVGIDLGTTFSCVAVFRDDRVS